LARFITESGTRVENPSKKKGKRTALSLRSGFKIGMENSFQVSSVGCEVVFEMIAQYTLHTDKFIYLYTCIHDISIVYVLNLNLPPQSTNPFIR